MLHSLMRAHRACAFAGIIITQVVESGQGGAPRRPGGLGDLLAGSLGTIVGWLNSGVLATTTTTTTTTSEEEEEALLEEQETAVIEACRAASTVVRSCCRMQMHACTCVRTYVHLYAFGLPACLPAFLACVRARIDIDLAVRARNGWMLCPQTR